MADSYFRGSTAIQEVARRITALAEFQGRHLPNLHTLRVKRTDYDLVKRWPKAAALHGFEFNGSEPVFMGLALLHDHSRPRYGGEDSAIGRAPVSQDHPPCDMPVKPI